MILIIVMDLLIACFRLRGIVLKMFSLYAIAVCIAEIVQQNVVLPEYEAL